MIYIELNLVCVLLILGTKVEKRRDFTILKSKFKINGEIVSPCTLCASSCVHSREIITLLILVDKVVACDR